MFKNQDSTCLRGHFIWHLRNEMSKFGLSNEASQEQKETRAFHFMFTVLNDSVKKH